MLLLIGMLLIGLTASVWGFMACFLPSRWEKLTETMSLADRWAEAGPRRLNPLVRLGNRAAGLVILVVGCLFAYMAASELYLVLTGRATSHATPSRSGVLRNSPMPGLTALSVFVTVAGILIALFPRKALEVFGRVWPAAQSVTQSAAPKVMLFVRLAAVFFALLAIMSLMR